MLRLKKGREASVLRHHPWIFSGAIDREEGESSGWCEVSGADGTVLGHGVYNARSQIRVRMWSFGTDDPGPEALLRSRMAAARERRLGLLRGTNAVRYVNSEGDFLPGIVLDKYGDTLVLQLVTEGVEKLRDRIVEVIRSAFEESNLCEKSVGRTEEGLDDRTGVIYGDDRPGKTAIQIDARRFTADIQHGHKSGFYLDQRASARRLRVFYGAGFAGDRPERMLDCFCYSGLFGILLRDHFQRIDFVDTSKAAVEMCRRNWELNVPPAMEGQVPNATGMSAEGRVRPPATAADFIRADAFEFLRGISERSYDLVVLDPPSFARRKNEVDGACRGYKDIQRLAFRGIRDGGHLAVFCCSQHISRDLFQKVVFSAARDANRSVQILERFGHDVDHPVSLDHPEGEYLQGFLLRAVE